MQALPSSHVAVLFVCAQAACGVPASVQTSSVQELLSSQSVLAEQVHTFGPPTQVPPVHVSRPVQSLPSLHPPVLFVCEQLDPGVPGSLQVSVVH